DYYCMVWHNNAHWVF
nr:immunoglobulin light chain junction region [Macaca mulatta]MOY05824.1 immunoglobulin light chain junction region [Macaca mulatta]MOY08598.1 immunoglobulin light chain junction region [Macaca mulatta]